jgi:hypothetical protein
LAVISRRYKMWVTLRLIGSSLPSVLLDAVAASSEQGRIDRVQGNVDTFCAAIISRRGMRELVEIVEIAAVSAFTLNTGNAQLDDQSGL